MRSRSKALLAGFIALLFLGAVALPVGGADTSNSEFVIIPEDDVFVDDLYAGAIAVTVEGTIDGDLIAFAGEEVVINGTVTGSVFAVSPTVIINGTVAESVRVSGSSLEVAGQVGRDVVAAMFSASFAPTSEVDGDVLVWAWNVDALGTVGKDLTGSMRNLDLAGTVEGDVDVSVGSLTVVDELNVVGDLGFRSGSDAEGLEMADVGGAIVHKTPLAPNLRVRALGLLGRFMVILFLTVSALTVAYGWPDRTTRAIARVSSEPGKAWLYGFAILVSPLVALLAAGVIFSLAPAAAAFPLLAILAPVVLAVFGIAFAVLLVAGIPAVGWLGGVLFKRLDIFGAILVGGLLVGLIWYLPIVGILVPLVVLPVGLGAWARSFRQPVATSGD